MEAKSANVSMLCVDELRLEDNCSHRGVRLVAVGLLNGDGPVVPRRGLLACWGMLDAVMFEALNGADVGPSLETEFDLTRWTCLRGECGGRGCVVVVSRGDSS